MTTPASPTAAWPPGVILRDIARGGLAGLPVGLVVGGLGGRLAMRLAALAVPEATGRFTENGNRIGDITLAGSLALVVFLGLFAGVAAGFVWVAIRPWLPGGWRMRALLAMPIAVAFGSFAIIDGTNPDFAILGHSPLVVAFLIGCIALVGLGVALMDEWLERRLPHPASAGARSTVVYGLVAGLGILFGLVIVVPQFLGAGMRLAGIALIGTGVVTLAWWTLRARGTGSPPTPLAALGRFGLAASVGFGFAYVAGETAAALAI